MFAERGWHFGPITRTDGFDLSRSITTQQYHFIYNALPERSYTPVDMADRNIAWDAIKVANESNKLSTLHKRLYFQRPRPIFELYNLEQDPHEMNNLAGQESIKAIEQKLRNELDRWMIREGDYLPLPAHVQKIMNGK